MSDRTKPVQFAVGDRVYVDGKHYGVITNHPGRVFNGWTVRLDHGSYRGVSDRQME